MVHRSVDDARDEVAHAAPTIAVGESGPSATDVCRYLLVPESGVRYGHPDRDHRCLAIRPYESLTQDKQRRICLTADHATCPAFQAARQRRLVMLAESGISGSAVEAGRSRPLSRTAPLVLETGHASFARSRAAVATARDGSRAGASDVPSGTGSDGSRRIFGAAGRGRTAARGWRSMTGPAVALVVVVAALAVVAARLPGPARPAVAGGSPTAASSPAPSLAPSPSAVAAPAVTPIVTPAATPTPPRPTSTAAASVPVQGTQTYRVKSGDTLSAIAARFGVSVAEIQQLNGIKDPRLLQIGQVLRIP